MPMARPPWPVSPASREAEPYDGKPLAGSGEIVDMLASDSQDYTLQVDKAGLYESAWCRMSSIRC